MKKVAVACRPCELGIFLYFNLHGMNNPSFHKRRFLFPSLLTFNKEAMNCIIARNEDKYMDTNYASKAITARRKIVIHELAFNTIDHIERPLASGDGYTWSSAASHFSSSVGVYSYVFAGSVMNDKHCHIGHLQSNTTGSVSALDTSYLTRHCTPDSTSEAHARGATTDCWHHLLLNI